jgi:hypothetical protein
MRFGDLPVAVLQHQRERAVEHPGLAPEQRRAVAGGVEPEAARFHSDELHWVVQERGEHANRVRAAADRRDDDVGQAARGGAELPPALVADHPLEVPHDEGERVWTGHRAEQVMGRVVAGGPVPQRLVDRVLERGAPGGHRHDGRAEQPHAVDIGALAFDVFRSHVDHGLEPEDGPGQRGRDAVLSRPGFGDEAALAQARGQEPLAQRLVRLVGATMEQILPLEPQVGAGVPREVAAAVQRRGSAGIGLE